VPIKKGLCRCTGVAYLIRCDPGKGPQNGTWQRSRGVLIVALLLPLRIVRRRQPPRATKSESAAASASGTTQRVGARMME